MGNLVINELYKILHKKNIYVLGIITFIMILINTILCKLNNVIDCNMLMEMEFSEVNIFIIICIVMIGGSSVSEEYNKGTIKYLLIKPYKRYKILLSKLFSSIIIFILSIMFYFMCCYICYGIIGKFNYDVSMFNNVIVNVLYLLPMYFIMLCFSLFVSCLVGNSSSSIILGISLFIGSNIVNELIIINELNYLYWIPTMCWDLSKKFNSTGINIVVCIVTIFILLLSTFIIFDKKEIKNT